ncbi:hypothetical protein Hdeb2414_s0002g00047311 [Helianthus debilis subsp. tardiflorus]
MYMSALCFRISFRYSSDRFVYQFFFLVSVQCLHLFSVLVSVSVSVCHVVFCFH